MEKITILCGMENWIEAYKFMCNVVESLKHVGIKDITINSEDLVVVTKYTQTCFHYDITKQPIGNVKADVIFGKEPYKRKLVVYLKALRPYDVGMGLVDYICECEKNGPTAEAEAKHEEAVKQFENAIRNHIDKLERYHCIDEFVSYSQADCSATYNLYKKVMNNTKTILPEIKDVIFNNPATIVFWADGTKTVVKADGEPYDPEKGLSMAICKKIMGNKRDYYHTFLHWLKKA